MNIYYNDHFFKYAAVFDKIGLMGDDTIYENDDIKEAIRGFLKTFTMTGCHCLSNERLNIQTDNARPHIKIQLTRNLQ